MKEKLKNYLIVCVLLITVCIIFYVVLLDEESNSYEEEFRVEENLSVIEGNNNNDEMSYYIDIKGEVKNPGVYEISSNSRLIDAINIAGGLTKNADTSLLNLSKKIIDEMSIKIYSKKEVSNAKESINKEPEIIEIIKEIEKECVCPEKEYTCDTKNDALIEENNSNVIVNKEENNDKNSEEENKSNFVNINIATKEELMTLTGIGEAKANAIIEYRENNRFQRIEDILNVSGIKDAMFEKIKDNITV